MTDRKIVQPMGYNMDNAVLDLFSQLPADWLPVKVNGVPVNVQVEFRFKVNVMQ